MNVIGYIQDSTADGLGLRDVLFVSGCSHKCKGCQNNESWDVTNGIPFTPYMEERLIENLKRMETPAITLSGGDPLFSENFQDTLKLCKKLKTEGIDIWLYTGYDLGEILLSDKGDILNFIDVLVDGKFEKELMSDKAKFRGSTNQIIYKITNPEEGRQVITDISHYVDNLNLA